MNGVLEPTALRLRGALARIQVGGRLPSVVACVVRDGAICWSDGYGEVPGPVEDTQYRIGSITKTITAVGVLRLVASGEVDLDAPLARWWAGAPYADVTVRALLGHGGGLPAEPAGVWWERAGRDLDPPALGAAEAGRAAPYRPGETFHYSNLGYALLGEVHARVRGTSWIDAVRADVLDPLAMSRTTYRPAAPAAQGFSVHPYAGSLIAEPPAETGAMAPAGQLWSTVADLARWAAFLLDGHDEVLGTDALRAAYEPQLGHGAFGPGSRHSLGFQLHGGLVGHSGSMPGFVASCFVSPEVGLGAVVLANGTAGLAPGVAATTLLDTLADAEPPLPAPWRPTSSVPDAIRPMLGVWHWGARPLVWAMEGDVLVVRDGGAERHRFAVVDDRVVATSGYFAGEEVVVGRRGDGSVSHLDLGTHLMTREPYAAGDVDDVVPGGRPSP